MIPTLTLLVVVAAIERGGRHSFLFQFPIQLYSHP